MAGGVLVGLLSLIGFRSEGKPSARSYYVDCEAGNDRRKATSPERAWKTLARANRARLRPGDRLLLKRGCTWSGPLVASWRGTSARPIVIGSYGAGSLPKIENAPDGNVVVIDGMHLILEQLHARADAPPRDPNCQNQPVGWRAGFVFGDRASYNTLRSSVATELAAGVHISTHSHHNRVLNNRLVGNTYMSVNTKGGREDDSGAWGLVVRGRNNEIAYNYFSGNNAWCSYDFGQEGASVEVFEGRGNNIHHNRSINDTTFSELGSTGIKASGNTFAYNLYVNTRHRVTQFLVVRGANDWLGATPQTYVHNNTVYLTGAQSGGVSCFAVCGADILTLRNNILWVNGRATYADASFPESNNIYWSDNGAPVLDFKGFAASPTSRRVAPGFVDRGKLNLRLKPKSPAVDAGANDAVRYRADLDRTSVPQGTRVDIGAYEYARGK
jgi:hypothetical protein